MKTSKGLSVILVMVMVMALALVFGGYGCVKGSGLFQSAYTVKYLLGTSNGLDAYFAVTVEGPAAELAVISTSPSGKPCMRFIGKSELLASNSYRIKIPISAFETGDWKLTVKTTSPEKVVWNQKVTLTQSQVTLKEVTPGFRPFQKGRGEFSGSTLEWVDITIQPTSNLPFDLPVDFSNASINFDQIIVGGKEYAVAPCGSKLTWGQNFQYSIRVNVICAPPDQLKGKKIIGWGIPPDYANFSVGETYRIKGKIICGRNKTELAIQKQFTVPPYEMQVASSH